MSVLFTSHTDEEFEDGNVQYGDDEFKLCVVKVIISIVKSNIFLPTFYSL